MTRTASLAMTLVFSIATTLLQAAPSAETLTALGEVRALTDKVTSFRADLEVRDKQGTEEQVVTSTLVVSKEHGWKLQSHGPEGVYHLISDFSNFHHYTPSQKMVVKSVADNPEAVVLFRKPVTDLNPLTLLDPLSLNLKGRTQLAGESVYHFEGTTSTQYLPQGKPVVRKMEAWISTEDGLPRKTIEQVGSGATGTTEYRNVEVNPAVSAQDFEFLAPPDVEVIDAMEQMRRMHEEAMKAVQTPAAGAAPPAPGQAPAGESEDSRP